MERRMIDDQADERRISIRNLRTWVRIRLGLTVSIAMTLGPVLRRRRGLILRQWETTMWQGMPIVIVAGISIGAVSWFQVRDILATYGAEGNLPSLVAIAVVVQTGPILTGLICAARLGASIAAELSTMNLTEEVDALRSLGVNVTEALVTPRFIAAVGALPTLTLVMDGSAIAGAMATEAIWGAMGTGAFLDRSLDLLTLERALPATFKTAVFGGLIAISSANAGLTCRRDAEAVGQASLKGVVGSIFAVLTADMVMVPTIRFLMNAAAPGF